MMATYFHIFNKTIFIFFCTTAAAAASVFGIENVLQHQNENVIFNNSIRRNKKKY